MISAESSNTRSMLKLKGIEWILGTRDSIDYRKSLSITGPADYYTIMREPMLPP